MSNQPCDPREKWGRRGVPPAPVRFAGGVGRLGPLAPPRWNAIPPEGAALQLAGQMLGLRGGPRDDGRSSAHSSPGVCLFPKRLERGRFVWPSAADGKVAVTPAQLSMLLEGIDWRAPVRTWRPLAAG